MLYLADARVPVVFSATGRAIVPMDNTESICAICFLEPITQHGVDDLHDLSTDLKAI